jgi:hypothetical protein
MQARVAGDLRDRPLAKRFVAPLCPENVAQIGRGERTLHGVAPYFIGE